MFRALLDGASRLKQETAAGVFDGSDVAISIFEAYLATERARSFVEAQRWESDNSSGNAIPDITEQVMASESGVFDFPEFRDDPKRRAEFLNSR
jgi:hypothetical protein